MCGIAGLQTLNGETPDQSLLDRLSHAMAHRGPDGQGYHVRPGLGLVQTRLAIIDLAGGDQPLYGPDGKSGGPQGKFRVALIANAEIYNYRELRQGLTDCNFTTNSDCEPPLHLYGRYGLDFVRHLRGMYAIAIDDPVKDRLVLARDPFGIKPLYYTQTSQGFAFASEPQALIKAGLVNAELVTDKRDELLQLQFTTGRQTPFAGIERVMPGEVLVVEKGRIVERHLHQALPVGEVRGLTEEDAMVLLDQYLEESIDLHQRADVDYGMFLSGGIDSSAVLAMMARLNVRPVYAFTAGFDSDAVHDERAHARKLAARVGAEHEEVSFGEEDFWNLLPRVAAAMDDPVADYAILPTYKLAMTAREAGIKVILSGEGGDELFAGYGRYRSAMRWHILGGRPMRRRGIFDGLGILRREPPDWRFGIARAEASEGNLHRTRLQVAQAVDIADWLPNDLLTKLDRCLMANGIEGRVPFIDPVLADFAFRLPDALKVRRTGLNPFAPTLGKWLLRKWLHKTLPEAEPFARKKGFTVPVADWIAAKGDRLGKMVAGSPAIAEMCQPGSVESLFSATGSARTKRQGQAAWSLLFYALWHRCHIEGVQPQGDVFHNLHAP